jgi:hypothetical protein
VPNTSVVLYKSFPGIFRRQFFKVEKQKKKIEKFANKTWKTNQNICFASNILYFL